MDMFRSDVKKGLENKENDNNASSNKMKNIFSYLRMKFKLR